MAVLLYASATDVSNWRGTTNPSNVGVLIRQASLLVREATENCWYAVDTNTNLPTDATILQAFNDATCAQVEFWIANSIDPIAVLAAADLLQSKKIGTASLTYNNAGAASIEAYNLRIDLAQNLCKTAWRILADANLQLNGVWVVG